MLYMQGLPVEPAVELPDEAWGFSAVPELSALFQGAQQARGGRANDAGVSCKVPATSQHADCVPVCCQAEAPPALCRLPERSANQPHLQMPRCCGLDGGSLRSELHGGKPQGKKVQQPFRSTSCWCYWPVSRISCPGGCCIECAGLSSQCTSARSQQGPSHPQAAAEDSLVPGGSQAGSCAGAGRAPHEGHSLLPAGKQGLHFLRHSILLLAAAA